MTTITSMICPHCREKVELNNRKLARPLAPGDVIICDECDMPSVITKDSVRKPTKKEMTTFLNDSRFQNHLADIVVQKRGHTRH